MTIRPRAALLLPLLALTACTGPMPLFRAAQPPVAKQYQWLHGSGEAAVVSREVYGTMARYVLAAQAARRQGQVVEGAVLAAGATPEAPVWEACGAKPSAVVLDVDETAILNTGANYDAARRGDPPFNAKRWDAWERRGAADVDPVPGAVEALAAIRAAGVTPVFVSNRQTKNAEFTAAAIARAGLGEAKPGETLFLQGDIAPGSGKDPRRAAVAAKWCVLAMAGDQLGDFSDAFNAGGQHAQGRRSRAQGAALMAKWGAGWFMLPNPLYGPWNGAGMDEVFPRERRWAGEGEATPALKRRAPK